MYIFNLSIYDTLTEYTMPFALEQSDLDEDEVLDYIHDFLLDLHDNRVRWIDGERFGTYDLEILNQTHHKNTLGKFFFQYVQRAKYKEGQWIDRRKHGRITQQEEKLGYDLTPTLPPPPNSYVMHDKTDCTSFVATLTDLEKLVLQHKLDGSSPDDFVRNHDYTRSRFYKVLNTLQTKAERHFKGEYELH
tara:strand:- start:17 stop:586 length:570 start_codon:yes stop_codon:yes gene_type:complete